MTTATQVRPVHVEIGSVTLGNDLPMAIIAGPCAMESRAHALERRQVAGLERPQDRLHQPAPAATVARGWRKRKRSR